MNMTASDVSEYRQLCKQMVQLLEDPKRVKFIMFKTYRDALDDAMRFIIKNAGKISIDELNTHDDVLAFNNGFALIEGYKASPLLKAIREGKKQFKFPPYIE
eukprot:1126127_1